MFRSAVLLVGLFAALSQADFKESSVKVTFVTVYASPRKEIRDGREIIVTGKEEHGSGTVVKVEKDRFWVLTCEHCIRSDEPGEHGLKIMLPSGMKYPADVLAYDAKKDLALVEVRANDARVSAAKLSDKNVGLGTAVVKVGWGTGSRKEDVGVTTVHTETEGYQNVLADVKSTNGDSGGGLFHKADGTLVGVVWGGRDDGLRARQVEDVHDFLATYQKVAPNKQGPRPGSSRPPAPALPDVRELPPGTTAVFVDLNNLKTRRVRVGNKVYEISVKEVPAAKAAVSEEIKVKPKEVPFKESAPFKE